MSLELNFPLFPIIFLLRRLLLLFFYLKKMEFDKGNYLHKKKTVPIFRIWLEFYVQIDNIFTTIN